MLLTVRNIRHIAFGGHERIERVLIYFEIPAEKNEKPENFHCCCKIINPYPSKEKKYGFIYPA
jgi:hypothetical protein